MIMNLIFINPLINTEDVLSIKYPDVDYIYHNRNNFNYKNDNDVIEVLDSILRDIDCSRVYDCGRFCILNSFNYTNGLSLYYYTILKLKNQFTYNIYIDKLIKRHIDNIIFEYHNPYIPNTSKKKTKIKKYKTKDLFTGDTVYMYQSKNKIVRSSNPDISDEFTIKKNRKSKSKKSFGVPISAMTFNFKKK